MPSRHSIKTYSADSYYHIYNRGVEKRNIFLDRKDLLVLFSYLNTYLTPKNVLGFNAIIDNPLSSAKERDKANKLLRLNNFFGSIELISFCFMRNHYHMLIRQKEEYAMDRFMNSLWTRYTMYFNKKYNRIGTLFQDVYKAVQVKTDEQLLYLSRYIHRNPLAKRQLRNLASQGDALESYFFSSYPEYIGTRNTEWVKSSYILSYWSKTQKLSYKNFVLQADCEEEYARVISSVII